jgi:hypothetical protein
MDDGRLPTETVVKAHLRQCAMQGIGAYILKRGDSVGGLVLLKLSLLDGTSRLLSQTRDLDGNPAWMAAGAGDVMQEADAQAYIDRATGRDPDLWVVEIEHRDGWHPFEGAVIG